MVDSDFHRVLFWPKGGTMATNVIGNGGTGSFTSSTGGFDGTSLVAFAYPRGVALDQGTSTPGVWISSLENRVMYFPYGSRSRRGCGLNPTSPPPWEALPRSRCTIHSSCIKRQTHCWYQASSTAATMSPFAFARSLAARRCSCRFTCCRPASVAHSFPPLRRCCCCCCVCACSCRSFQPSCVCGAYHRLLPPNPRVGSAALVYDEVFHCRPGRHQRARTQWAHRHGDQSEQRGSVQSVKRTDTGHAGRQRNDSRIRGSTTRGRCAGACRIARPSICIRVSSCLRVCICLCVSFPRSVTDTDHNRVLRYPLSPVAFT